MAGVLAYAEVRNGALRSVAGETVSAGRRLAAELGGEVHALVIGPPGVGETAGELAGFGSDRIFVVEGEAFENYHPDAAVEAIQNLQERHGYSAVLFPASAQGKDLAPRVAARLDRGLATEVTELTAQGGRLIATRPVYAGKAYARVMFPESPALVSLRPNVFHAEPSEGRGEVEALAIDGGSPRIRVRGIEQGERERLDVAEAQTVVSGGRGLQESENWHLLEELVDALGDNAALGASRAVVDAGWRPHPEQVGQTGKTVSPNLYFAIGISGAIQHLAGMRTAKVIVAINKDPEAPIFKIADYGIVGDLFEVVPRLTEELRKVRSET